MGVNKVRNLLGMTLDLKDTYSQQEARSIAVVEDKDGVQCGNFRAVEARAILGNAGESLEQSLHRMQGMALLYHLIAPPTSQNLTYR